MRVPVVSMLAKTGRALARWLGSLPWEAGGDRMLRLL